MFGGISPKKKKKKKKKKIITNDAISYFETVVWLKAGGKGELDRAGLKSTTSLADVIYYKDLGIL